jgi:hypothetical protein
MEEVTPEGYHSGKGWLPPYVDAHDVILSEMPRTSYESISFAKFTERNFEMKHTRTINFSA